MAQFGDSDDDLKQVYDHVMSGTTVKPFVAEALFPLWLVGYRRGEPKYERAAFYPLMDPDIMFQWNWFTQWRKVFAEGDMPYSWLNMARRIKDKRLGLREDMAQLLSKTIGMAIINRRSAFQHTRSSWPNRHLNVSADCDVSRRIATQRLQGVLVGDWQTYPPYFPGDTASLSFY